MNGRLDGHIVQGHVDQTAVCRSTEADGSWYFTLNIHSTGRWQKGYLTVDKGSVTVTGEPYGGLSLPRTASR